MIKKTVRKDMEVKYWQNPAEASVSSTDGKEENGSMHIYTDGNKTERGVGSGIAFSNQGDIPKAYSAA